MCHVWRQRATFAEEVYEASHWKKSATMGSQRATLVRWRRKTETYFFSADLFQILRDTFIIYIDLVSE